MTPNTPLQTVGSPVGRSLAPRERRIGGADRDRTGDPLNAIQVLSQTELQPHGEAAQDNTGLLWSWTLSAAAREASARGRKP